MSSKKEKMLSRKVNGKELENKEVYSRWRIRRK
jgi:hypothetical protein